MVFSLLGRGIDIAGNLAMQQEQAWLNEHAMEKQHKLNEQSAEAAYKRNENFYLNYQSPEAMRKQLEEAGLNPALMYGNGVAGSSGHIAPQGSTSALGVSGGMSFGPTPNDIVMMAEARKLNAESQVIEETGIRKGESEITRNNAEAIKAEASSKLDEATAAHEWSQTAWQNIRNESEKIDLAIKSATKETVVETAKQGLELIKAQIKETNSRSIEEQSKANLNNAQAKKEERLREELANYYWAQAQLAGQEAALKFREEIILAEEADALIDKVFAEAREANARADNEEDYIRRFNEGIETQKKELKQRQTEMWVNAASNLIGAAADVAGGAYVGKAIQAGNVIKGAPVFRQTKQYQQGGKKVTDYWERRGNY